MANPMGGDGITLLDRLDFLRGCLQSIRIAAGEGDLLSLGIDEGEIDQHLVTVDDACKALQA